MSYDETFTLCNTIAVFSWIALVAAPYLPWTQRIITGVIITGLATLYAWLVLSAFGREPGGFESFTTLEGVMQLFTGKQATLAGWIHYLAFDMMTGLYIVNNARKHNIPRIALLPCLFFTFMLGPIGLLMYFVVRAVKTRQWFHQYV